MKIDFSYEKKKIDYISGFIFKGKHYRCNYVRFKTLYRNPAEGTETVELYNFMPKDKTYASALILHGLGSANVKYMIWMARRLASVGINTTILILPGNYTRVDKKSVSGRSYLWPDLKVMYRFWEHGVIDTLTTIDFLKQEGLWKKDHILLGYCLGGMVGTIVEALEPQLKHFLLMTTGGHLPEILYNSPATKFVKRLIEKGFKDDYDLHNPDKIFDIYNAQFEKVRKMSLDELMNSESIHPLFKIDPLSYAHLINPKKVTFVEAFFDKTLSKKSRKMLFNEFHGAKRYIIPTGHVTWLPFEFLLAKNVIKILNIEDLKIKTRLYGFDEIEEALDDEVIKK
ncbi:alpha/beta hydrolase [Marinitoga lauensis]|uniref:alpha/beta hydrolase n=1 Tax=Marinitoga lauensis TaxID=2201189 RepID=UPI0010127C4D|nr:alpha/beta hydrolase [Marinitoga lauensis]